MRNDREKQLMEAYKARLDGIVNSASQFLSREAIQRAAELVDHNEGPIGISYLGWAIVNERRSVPASLIRAVREHAGDEELPPELYQFALPFPLGAREPSLADGEPLDLVVTDIFRLKDRGVVATGEIRGGILHRGEIVEIVRPDGQTMRVGVRGIEFACGPKVRRDRVGFQLEPEADDFLVEGAVIRSVTNE